MTTTPKPVADRAAAPSVPAGVPDKVTRQQVCDALRSLGLPADAITEVHIDMDLISMTVVVRTPTGNIWAKDTGRALTAAAYVDVVEDPRPERPATGGTPNAARSGIRLSVTDPGADAFKRLFLNSIAPDHAAEE
ncbi:hypothetical protein [Kitasatospora sp. NPDC056184]|uniref:hypothetical protein n=1 Tax=Kitasatospora sp. NPDC056184 TaxID=3345738 RepID=UPI0035DF2C4B